MARWCGTRLHCRRKTPRRPWPAYDAPTHRDTSQTGAHAGVKQEHTQASDKGTGRRQIGAHAVVRQEHTQALERSTRRRQTRAHAGVRQEHMQASDRNTRRRQTGTHASFRHTNNRRRCPTSKFSLTIHNFQSFH